MISYYLYHHYHPNQSRATLRSWKPALYDNIWQRRPISYARQGRPYTAPTIRLEDVEQMGPEPYAHEHRLDEYQQRGSF